MRFLLALLLSLPFCAVAQTVPPVALTPSTLEDALPIPSKVTTTMGDAFGDEADAGTELRVLIQTRYGETAPSSSRPGERALAQDPDGWVLNRALPWALMTELHWAAAVLGLFGVGGDG